jgi:hypothetical protein
MSKQYEEIARQQRELISKIEDYIGGVMMDDAEEKKIALTKGQGAVLQALCDLGYDGRRRRQILAEAAGVPEGSMKDYLEALVKKGCVVFNNGQFIPLKTPDQCVVARFDPR